MHAQFFERFVVSLLSIAIDIMSGVLSDIQFTVYPDDGHDSWTHAYNEPKFFDWLLSHHR